MTPPCAHFVPARKLAELEGKEARGLVLEAPGGPLDVVLVTAPSASGWRAYINRCPHQGTPLETFPDRFLSRDGAHLICSTHGARFDRETGLCVAGPCTGDRLTSLGVEARDGMLYIDVASKTRGDRTS